jgi:DegV family protein with EDD domain
MNVGIITDTSCDLPAGLENELQVKTVSLIFRFGMHEFPDKSIPMPEFLERVKKTWPTTSAPAPGEFVEIFRKSLTEHDQLLCITITGKHSATYSSAVLASQQIGPDRIAVLDSASVSIGQALQVLVAAQAAQSGAGMQEIISRVKALQLRSHLYISLDTVENLVKGGRASQMTGILAGLLKIRPILTLVDGQLTLRERPRGRTASKQRMLELAASHFPAEFVSVGHVGCAEEAREIAAAIAQQTGFPEEKIFVVETGMAIAVHGGQGTLGIVVISKE